MNFSFTLKDNNIKSYRLFTWFLFFLHVTAAGIFAFNIADKDIQWGIYILLGFYLFVTTLYFFFSKQKKAFETFSFTMALFYANFWLKYVGVIALFIFAAVFIFVNFIQKKKTSLMVTDAGVHLKRIFKTLVYSWADIDNLIFKDGLLTLDFKSNKLLQVEITGDASNVDESEFNRFCREQLNKKMQS